MFLNEIKSLIKYVDYIVFFNKDEIANNYAHNCTNKSMNEIYVLRRMMEKLENVNFKMFYKLSGRYNLSSNFYESNFNINEPVFKSIYNTWDGKPVVHCVLYSVPKIYISEFIKIFKVCESVPSFIDIEHELFKQMTNANINFQNIEVLGFEGYLGNGGGMLFTN